MRSRSQYLACCLLLLPIVDAGYRDALPGYQYKFPRDYFSHPDFQTEWWYYTGNVRSADGRRLGFELTFFRQGVDRNKDHASPWDVHDIYLAHLALSDLDGGAFYHTERINRAGPGIAGISESDGRIWNGNWQIRLQHENQELHANDQGFQLDLMLHSEKPPVLHGEDGVSQKAEGPGRASHYMSLTRLATSGRIDLQGKHLDVAGFAWMDHEFFTDQLEADQVGWDWLSLQLEDNTELMLFHIRRKDGSIDRYSAGTFIDARGKSMHLGVSDFTLQPIGEVWKSNVTNARYPIHWKIAVPKIGMELAAQTRLPSQEFTGGTLLAPNYWEGAIELNGYKMGSPVRGAGYLEMTGYDRPVQVGR
jgi:predicted secreted hydrolase